MAVTVALILFPGLSLLTLGMARATIEAADRHSGGGKVRVACVSVTGEAVKSACGVTVTPDPGGWSLCDGAAALVPVAGTGWPPYLPMGLRGAVLHAQRRGAALIGAGGGAGVLRALGQGDGDTGGAADGTHAIAAALLPWLARALSPEIAARAAQTMGLAPEASAPLPDPSSDAVIARMQALMADTLARPLTLAQLADRLGLSVKQLRTRCRAVLGTTPGRVYRDMRLGSARATISGTAQPVATVAQAAGFASPSAFTRRFRNEFGTSPRALRAARHGDAQPAP